MNKERHFTPLGLLMLSVNGMVGSAWLFAPFYAAKIAGAASLVAWIIAGLGTTLIALTFAELSVLFPVTGGTAHIPRATHGLLTSFVLSFLAWISALTMAPIEVQAVLQYASTYFVRLMAVNGQGVPVLTGWGYFWATVLMLLFSGINLLNHRGLMRFNGLFFWIKISIIVFTVFILLHTSFQPAHFSGLGASLTSVQGWHAILSAVALGGVAFAFTGFKHSVDLAGEARQFAWSIPLSIVGSVFIALCLYLGLQTAFIAALPSEHLVSGWQALHFAGDKGPFVGLLMALGLFFCVKLVYFNALASPSGTGLIYVTSTARMVFGMSQIGLMPAFLAKLNANQLPARAILFNFCIGMCLFLPLPGWQAMVNFLVSSMVISYAMGPIALLCLRLNYPDKIRHFRLPCSQAIGFMAFYFCNLLSYWTGWETMSKLGIALCLALSLLGLAVLRGKVHLTRVDCHSGIWLFPYFLGLILLSYLGSFGGLGFIGFGWDFLVIAVFSFLMLKWALASRRRDSILELP